jgi:hypothetical protein
VSWNSKVPYRSLPSRKGTLPWLIPPLRSNSSSRAPALVWKVACLLMEVQVTLIAIVSLLAGIWICPYAWIYARCPPLKRGAAGNPDRHLDSSAAIPSILVALLAPNNTLSEVYLPEFSPGRLLEGILARAWRGQWSPYGRCTPEASVFVSVGRCRISNCVTVYGLWTRCSSTTNYKFYIMYIHIFVSHNR